MNFNEFTRELPGVCPILRVIGAPASDPKGWEIVFAENATPQQRAAAEELRAACTAVEALDPVPASVSNFQARAVMRQFKMPDGRSLFTTVDIDLRAAVEATKALDEFDPRRVQADLAWQAWEQANTYDRQGAITQLLAGRYGFDGPTTDELFRKADLVTA